MPLVDTSFPGPIMSAAAAEKTSVPLNPQCHFVSGAIGTHLRRRRRGRLAQQRVRVNPVAVPHHDVAGTEHDAVQVVLLRTVEVGPANKNAIRLLVGRSAARRLGQPGLDRVVPGRGVLFIPDDSVRPTRQVKSGAHLDELHVADLLFRAIRSTLPPVHLYSRPADPAIGITLRRRPLGHQRTNKNSRQNFHVSNPGLKFRIPSPSFAPPTRPASPFH